MTIQIKSSFLRSRILFLLTDLSFRRDAAGRDIQRLRFHSCHVGRSMKLCFLSKKLIQSSLVVDRMSIWSQILSQSPPFPPKATAFKMKILLFSPPSKSLSCFNLLSRSKPVLLCAMCCGRRYLLNVCLYVLKKNLVFISSSPQCGSKANPEPFLSENKFFSSQA